MTACDCCRVKKTKCNGQNPCQKCITHKTVCVYSERIKKDRVFTTEEVRLIENKVEILTNSLLKITQVVQSNNKGSLNKLSAALNRGSSGCESLQINSIIKAVNGIKGGSGSGGDNNNLNSPATSPLRPARTPSMSSSIISEITSSDIYGNVNTLNLDFPYNPNYTAGKPVEEGDIRIPKFLEDMDYLVGNDLRDDFETQIPSSFLFDNTRGVALSDLTPQI